MKPAPTPTDSDNSAASVRPARPRGRDDERRDERGDFTIPLLLFSVLLLAVASVAYAWPKAASTHLNIEHIAAEALKAGAIHAAQTIDLQTLLPCQPDELDAGTPNVQATIPEGCDFLDTLVKPQVENFVASSRVNGVDISLVGGPECTTVNGRDMLRGTFYWEFRNQQAVLDITGDVTNSTHVAVVPDQGVCQIHRRIVQVQ